MQVTTIRFLKRIQENQFEPAELEVTANVLEGESPDQAIADLKALVHRGLSGILPEAAEPTLYVEKVALKPLANEPAATANFVKEAPVKEDKPKSAPRTRAKKETEAPLKDGPNVPPVIPTEAAPSENTGGTSTVASGADSKDESALQPEAPKVSAPVVGKGIVAYDSTVKEHRSRFATYLGTNFPKWTPDSRFGKTPEGQQPTAEKSAYAEEVRVFSKNLHGKAFEDAKGNMLESFKNDLAEFFAHAK